MDVPVTPDTLHRGFKLAMDSGEVATLEAARELFGSYRLAVAVGPDAATDVTAQAALLTIVNAARRTFLGGVSVTGVLDTPLRLPLPGANTLGVAVERLGGRVAGDVPTEAPLILLGDAAAPTEGQFAVRVTYNGWVGGVVPADDGRRLPNSGSFTPAGVLAGSLAVAEAFQFVRRSNPYAGRRAVGLSLWQPGDRDWLGGADPGPPLTALPNKLWLIGLGQLGQAYLWTLGLLPYATPEAVQIVLQDTDALVPANDSTSLLTDQTLVGQRKTRAMARWCEARGFRASLVERRFADDFGRNPEEPEVALCGVDNASARAALERVGFHRVIEAGLGRGEDYLGFQVHTFPATRRAADIWARGASPPAAPPTHLPAYQALAAEGVDECGVTLLAGRTVGVPFVGAAVSALVVAELLRLVIGASQYEVVDGTLRDLARRKAIPRPPDDPYNPGFTPAKTD